MSVVVLNVNGHKAVRIKAVIIKDTGKAVHLDCEGDKEWFPASTIRNNSDGTFDIQEWIYKEKFPE